MSHKQTQHIRYEATEAKAKQPLENRFENRKLRTKRKQSLGRPLSGVLSVLVEKVEEKEE